MRKSTMLIHSEKYTKGPAPMSFTLKEIKAFLKIDYGDEDELLHILLEAATDKLERYIGKAIIEQEWTASYSEIMDYCIDLPVVPVLSIVGIQLTDVCQSTREFPKELYFLEGNRVHFSSIPYCFIMKIKYRVGMAQDRKMVPSVVKCALLEIIGNLYKNRGFGKDANFSMCQYDELRFLKL
ncbi:conserved hypothetical protein [Alphaproteobacteria bacterium]